MITITLGTIPYPFDRAVNWLDLLLEKEIITEPVFLQHGVTDVSRLQRHELVTAAPLLPGAELAEKVRSSNLIISHAGQGSTRKLAVQRKSFIVIPRLAQHGEHIDDHQLLFSQGVDKLGVTVCTTLASLEKAIQNPPKPLRKDLFSGPKLGEFLAHKYPREVIYQTTSQYAKQRV